MRVTGPSDALRTLHGGSQGWGWSAWTGRFPGGLCVVGEGPRGLCMDQEALGVKQKHEAMPAIPQHKSSL